MDSVSDAAFLAVIRARIRAARLARNLSQEEVAAVAQLEPRTYQHLESPMVNRKFNPRLDTLIAVSEALKVDLIDLVRPSSPEELLNARKVQAVTRQGRKRKSGGE